MSSSVAKERSSPDHSDAPAVVVESTPGEDQGPISSATEPDAPPAYGDAVGRIQNEQDGFGANADVASDGRVNIRINQKTRRLSSLLIPALRSQLDLLPKKSTSALPVPPIAVDEAKPPPLNIVIQIVGSRGDVQPFVALGQVLKREYGHRIRLATHGVFKGFVEDNGLEFFDIGGDPSELMAFMVKNPGLMPGFDTLRSGDVGKRRKEIGNIIKGCWRSCIEAGDGSGAEASDKNVEDWNNPDGGSTAKPFVADAIIANPPSFAHIHCAEKLGIPLHMMFTMPWSPTQAFPHPLANIESSNADTNLSNFVSYALVDMMTWQGLGDVINRFRQKSLGLEPMSLMWAPGMLARLKIPWTYCWSPALIPKPKDWGPHVFISGFYFLSLGSNFTPEPDLAKFLDAGPPPLYIGFGSIVVEDPNALTKLIFEAVKKTGQRALVSKGWGGFGADQLGIPDGVFMLGNVPHDWLFQRVSCVVHHGGAGTTAAGITAGKPTVVVPFFGDQAFWGHMVARAGAGPEPLPYKGLTAEGLATAIADALKPSSLNKAEELSEKISHETGTTTGALDFHQGLNIDKLRCGLDPFRAAVWRLKRTEVRMSAFAAAVLGSEGLLDFNDLKLYRPTEYEADDGPWDPITGGASALIGTTVSMTMGFADLPSETLKALKIHPDSVKRQSMPRKASKAPTDRGSPTATPGTPRPEGAPRPEDSGNLKAAPDETGGTSSNHMSAPTYASSPTSGVQTDDGHEAALAHAVGTQIVVAEQGEGPGEPKEEEKSGKIGSPSPSHQNSTNQFNVESALATGKGVSRFVSAGIKSPMDFTLSLAQGFHNAPKLYGDDTVRKTEKITGFSSGLKAAGKSFGYGFFDGITGLVTQPMEGAKKEGGAGFMKGVGKGIAGIVLKPGAGIWGLPGYTSKGIYKELYKYFGANVQNYIIAGRTAQGLDDLKNSTFEERQAIIDRWRDMRRFIKKKRNLGEEQMINLKRALIEAKEKSAEKSGSGPTAATMHASDLQDARDISNRSNTFDSVDTGIHSPDDEEDVQEYHFSPSRLASDKPQTNLNEDEEFEEAIRRSIAETSTGNPEEDAQIERAIRASVAELEAAKSRGANEEELQRAMQQQIEEARHGVAGEHDGSMAPPTDHGDEAYARALAESKREHDDEAQRRHEEEAVMQHMIKQSLAETEMSKAHAGSASASHE